VTVPVVRVLSSQLTTLDEQPNRPVEYLEEYLPDVYVRGARRRRARDQVGTHGARDFSWPSLTSCRSRSRRIRALSGGPWPTLASEPTFHGASGRVLRSV
jgi:hypothetical protein